jgi:hypothetical protein
MSPHTTPWARHPGLLARAATYSHAAATADAAHGARLAVLADQQVRAAAAAHTTRPTAAPQPLPDDERWRLWEQGEEQGYTAGLRWGTLTGFCWGLVLGAGMVAAGLHVGVWLG